MKKSLFLLLPILTLGLVMAGCKSNKVEPTPEPDVVEPDTPEEPEEPEVPAKTVEEVVTDINGVFSGLGIENLLSWYDEYNCYIGGLNLGAAEHAEDDQHAAELQSATEFVVSYLPEYLEVKESIFEEEYDDYYIGLSVDEVAVENFGYVNSGNVIVQIQVASIAE